MHNSVEESPKKLSATRASNTIMECRIAQNWQASLVIVLSLSWDNLISFGRIGREGVRKAYKHKVISSVMRIINFTSSTVPQFT